MPRYAIEHIGSFGAVIRTNAIFVKERHAVRFANRLNESYGEFGPVKIIDTVTDNETTI